MKAAQRNKILEKLIRGVYSSLESHLPYTYQDNNRAFEIKCIKEYAELINLLTELYE